MVASLQSPTLPDASGTGSLDLTSLNSRSHALFQSAPSPPELNDPLLRASQLSHSSSSLDRFATFEISDASGDSTRNPVFHSGALRISYNLLAISPVRDVRLEAVSDRGLISLGSWTTPGLNNGLINLATVPELTPGHYQIRAVAYTVNGTEIVSESHPMQVQSWESINGSLMSETLYYSNSGTNIVVLGHGGIDTLDLGVTQSDIVTINSIPLSLFNSESLIPNQAILGGMAWDYITLIDGREIYLQGVEWIRFADGSDLELQVRSYTRSEYTQVTLEQAVQDIADIASLSGEISNTLQLPTGAEVISRIWSVNLNVIGQDLRQLLIDTATDLGIPGWDITFGYGLIDADAAASRARALGYDYALATLYSGASLLV